VRAAIEIGWSSPNRSIPRIARNISTFSGFQPNPDLLFVKIRESNELNESKPLHADIS